MGFSNEQRFARVFLPAKLRTYKLTLLLKELQNLTTTKIQEPSNKGNKTNSKIGNKFTQLLSNTFQGFSLSVLYIFRQVMHYALVVLVMENLETVA